jgi:hypothetical protein
MSDLNGLPPDAPFGTEGGNPSPMGTDPQPPNNFSPDQSMMPPPVGGGYSPTPGGGGFQVSNATKFGTVIMLAFMTLLIPMGLYKIGSPHPCEGKKAKTGECIVLAQVPASCTPSRFAEESEYITCKMVGAINNDIFKATKPDHFAKCMKLHGMIKSSKFKCYGIPGVMKKDKNGKTKDPFTMAPLDVQKFSILNSLSKETLSGDFIFTMLTMILILIGMAIAAYFANKKNRDSFLWITGVFLIGMTSAYIYRYSIAGFYNNNIVVMLIALVGMIPVAVIAMGKNGKMGILTSESDHVPPGDHVYVIKAPPVVPEDALAPEETTKFQKMGLQNTPIFTKIFILGFIGMVLGLIPIGLQSMGKSSSRASAMDKEAAKMSSLVRKKAAAKGSNVDLNEDEEGDDDEE